MLYDNNTDGKADPHPGRALLSEEEVDRIVDVMEASLFRRTKARYAQPTASTSPPPSDPMGGDDDDDGIRRRKARRPTPDVKSSEFFHHNAEMSTSMIKPPVAGSATPAPAASLDQFEREGILSP